MEQLVVWNSPRPKRWGLSAWNITVTIFKWYVLAMIVVIKITWKLLKWSLLVMLLLAAGFAFGKRRS